MEYLTPLVLFGPLLPAALAAGLITFMTSKFNPANSPYTDGWAGALSFLYPGAGQVYKGYVGTGMLLMVITPITYAALGVLAGVFHVLAILHAIRARLPEKVQVTPRACCSICGREYLESELTTHAGKLWCATDYQAALAAG